MCIIPLSESLRSASHCKVKLPTTESGIKNSVSLWLLFKWQKYEVGIKNGGFTNPNICIILHTVESEFSNFVGQISKVF